MKVVTLKMGSIHSVNDNDRAAEPHLVSDSSERKRKRDEMEEESEISDKIMHTPKKRCLQTTSNYIYNTLFVRGENSDIDILALGKKWNLHKLYLCQSRYFSSMFSGSWKESKQTSVSMEIPDPNITTKALDIAFGSLYQDSIEIIPVEVVSILAAATLLGQDGLIQQCCDIMEETVSVNTVCVFHESAVLYGQMDVKQKCCVWLQNNLMIRHTNFKLLREISIDLMQSVILSPDLLVIQVEMDIYTLLKKWVFLQLHPSWKGLPKTLTVDMGKFYGACYDDNHEYFLDSEQGQAYVQPFKALRLNHIFMDLGSINMIEQDHLIPHDWLVPIYEMQWKQMLKVEQGRDKGPSKPTEFGTNSMRVGRVLQKEGDYCWRWTGFNYGIDLLVSFTNRLIILKRNSLTHTSTTSISMQPKRFFLYRITITGYNATGQIRFKKTSGTVCTKLQKDEEVVVMGISHKIAFPLYFSANFSFCSPLPGVKPQTTQQQNLSADIHDHQPVENQLDAQDDE